MKNLRLAFFLKSPVGILTIVLAILIVVGPSYYFYQKYQETNKILQDPTARQQLETKSLIERVGKIIALPVGEQPTIATVSDITKLKDQTFFKNAQNGDKVLIYSRNKKAILYRPSINKIIEVGPVNIGQPQITPGPTQKKTGPTEKLSPSLSPRVSSPSATPSSE